ncbi:hypothetical protein INR49_004379 [Caranx melampygus]|nr:hypothetical protein INR49_004379 [Caranx melampygus]
MKAEDDEDDSDDCSEKQSWTLSHFFPFFVFLSFLLLCTHPAPFELSQVDQNRVLKGFVVFSVKNAAAW